MGRCTIAEFSDANNGREGAARTVTFNLGADGKAISMTLKGAGAGASAQETPLIESVDYCRETLQRIGHHAPELVEYAEARLFDDELELIVRQPISR